MSSQMGAPEQAALEMDRSDPLARVTRSRFYIPPGTIYMDGNSLGLLSLDSEASVLRTLEEWKTRAIDGWMTGDSPWFTLGERLGERVAALVGAEASEVVVTGTTTVNIHALVSAFYRPRGRRRQILATELDFPSDIYALLGQLSLRHGADGHDLLVKAPSRDGHTIEENDIIELMTDSVALALLPSVLYRSGQLLDMERLTASARERDIIIGFDCCHSIGVVPHHLSAWGADFALWCHYKYMNSGPGAAAGLYINSRWSNLEPALPGWWGYRKDRQFDMLHRFEAQKGAGGFQISSPAILSTAPLEGALDLVEEVGVDRIRARSLRLTGYLMSLLEGLPEGLGSRIVTPRSPRRRGGHVALAHPHARELVRLLGQRGIIVDFRHPDIVRIAPSPLYSTFHEVWSLTAAIGDILAGL